MRSIWSALVLSLIVGALLLTSGPVEGKELAGTVDIDRGEYQGWKMDISIPSVIEYDVESLNGTLIDVYVLDGSNYDKYVGGQSFEPYSKYSFVNVTQATMNMTVLSGTVYIVIDVSNISSAIDASVPLTAEVRYWISSSFSLSSVPEETNVWLVGALVVALVVSLFIVILVMRNAWKNRKV